jgi:hypothetical protein
MLAGFYQGKLIKECDCEAGTDFDLASISHALILAME